LPIPRVPTSPLSPELLPQSLHLFAPSLLNAASDQPLLLSFKSSAISVFLSPETTLAPLNGSSEAWVRSLVWSDFRVAVAFFVVVPLVLLSWAVAARRPPNNPGQVDVRSPIADTVLRLMTSYWQASALLLITVALNVQESNAGAFAGLFAQAMIFASLWWWEDLNEEVTASSEPIGRVFAIWRSVASVAAATGVLVQVPFQGCVGSTSLVDDAWCAPWLEPPRFAANLIGLEPSPTLAAVATASCTLYTVMLAYYAIVAIPSIGRSGRAARPSLMDVATPIGVWRALGFIDPQNPKQ